MLHGYKHEPEEIWFMWKAAAMSKLHFMFEEFFSAQGRHDLAAKHEKEAFDWHESGWECYHGM